MRKTAFNETKSRNQISLFLSYDTFIQRFVTVYWTFLSYKLLKKIIRDKLRNHYVGVPFMALPFINFNDCKWNDATTKLIYTVEVIY
jgi:hypothetical protein